MRDYAARLRELADWASQLEHQLTGDGHEAVAALSAGGGRRGPLEILGQGPAKSCDNLTGSFDALAESLGKPRPFDLALQKRETEDPSPYDRPSGRPDPRALADAIDDMRRDLGILTGGALMAACFPQSEVALSRIESDVRRVLKAYDAIHVLLDQGPPRHWWAAEPDPL